MVLPIGSTFNVLKKLSAHALSQQSPLRLMLCLIPPSEQESF